MKKNWEKIKSIHVAGVLCQYSVMKTEVKSSSGQKQWMWSHGRHSTHAATNKGWALLQTGESESLVTAIQPSQALDLLTKELQPRGAGRT